jgi:Family of unknown function (DUF5677)
MPDQPLTLADFEVTRITFDRKIVSQYQSRAEYVNLAFELMKEVGVITAVLASAYRFDENYKPRLWSRNEAIKGGLMVRLTKLQRGILDAYQADHFEIADVSQAANRNNYKLEYLIKINTDELFEAYVVYSLREEKKLLNMIQSNIAQRGHEIPIEVSMKVSIEDAFVSSGIRPEEIDERKTNPWGASIWHKAKEVGLGAAYQALVGLPNHAVHGNWQDLVTYQLERDGEQFKPFTDWTPARSEILFMAAMLSVGASQVYLNDLMPESGDRKQVDEYLADLHERVHEAFELMANSRTLEHGSDMRIVLPVSPPRKNPSRTTWSRCGGNEAHIYVRSCTGHPNLNLRATHCTDSRALIKTDLQMGTRWRLSFAAASGPLA